MAWATIRRETWDDRRVVIKTTRYDARLEADGLRALAEAGAPTPEVIEVDRSRLVMDEVDGPEAWEDLGRRLARCHRSSTPAYGYHTDNVLGPLTQVNTWEQRWSDFYVRYRLTPYLEDLPDTVSRRFLTAFESGKVAALLEHGQAPSLIHGDLWSGNIVGGRWLIDPAVHYADRELDLAFAAVFGGIPDRMRRAYCEEWPLDDGWQERRPALQLYHLLVHVRIFGESYVGMVTERLDRLGW